MSAPTSQPRLSLIIPAWNEARRLPATLEAIRREFLAHSAIHVETLVVDDGSDDGTRRVALAAASEGFPVRVLGGAARRGKGAAVRCGMLAACGELRLMLDADLATPVSEWTRLAEWAQRGFDVVIGSRCAADALIQRRASMQRRGLDACFRALRRRILLPDLLDTQCGFKLFTAVAANAVFSRARLDGFLFDCEALALARQLGFRIREVGVTWRDDPDSRVRPWIDAPRMLVDLLCLRTRLAPRPSGP